MVFCNCSLYCLKYLLVHARRGDISLVSGRFARNHLRRGLEQPLLAAFLATNSLKTLTAAPGCADAGGDPGWPGGQHPLHRRPALTKY